jgi:ribonuclease R
LIKLTEAAPVTGGLVGELVELDDRAMPRGPVRRRGKGAKPAKRKVTTTKRKAAKTQRKVKRTR